MKQQPVKLYEAEKTNLPTNQPVRYYGRADGNVYVVYSEPYETKKAGKIKIEYKIARLENCSFNSEKTVFKDGEELRKDLSGQYPQLDTPDIHKHIKVIDKNRTIQGAFELAEKWFFNNKKLPMIRTK